MAFGHVSVTRALVKFSEPSRIANIRDIDKVCEICTVILICHRGVTIMLGVSIKAIYEVMS
jgi:hypothetical protein